MIAARKAIWLVAYWVPDDPWMLPSLQFSRGEWPLALALRFMGTTIMPGHMIFGIGRANRADHFTGRLLRCCPPEWLNPRRRYRNEVRFPGVAQLGKLAFDLFRVFVERLFDSRALFQKLLNGRFLL